MTGRTDNRALATLGDRLETAAGHTIANGGLRPEKRRRAALLIVPAIATVALIAFAVGVLSPGATEDAEAAVIASSQETLDASTGRFEVTVSGNDLPAIGSVELRMDGAYDIAHDRFQASLDFAGLLGALSDDPITEGMGEFVDAPLTVLVDGQDVYLNIEFLTSMFGAETEWIKFTVPAEGEDDPFGSTVNPGSIDPAALLEMLQGAGADMAVVGREEVRGAETTHYSGSISMQKAYDSIPADERADLENLLGGLLPESGLTLPDLPVDVYIDDQDHVRRISMSLAFADFGIEGFADSAASFSVNIEYFDIGEDVAIEVPDPSTVTTLEDILGFDLLGELDGILGDDFDLGELGLGDAFDGLGEGLDELGEGLGDLDLGELEQELEELFGGDGSGEGEIEPVPTEPLYPGPTVDPGGRTTGEA